MIEISYIALSRLLVDFGLLVLIWLVQLVIYPGLIFYSNEDLKKWHWKYTGAVTYIVLPLMLSQLLLSICSVWSSIGVLTVIHLGLVLIAWLLTFLKAVPLHQSLESSENPLQIAEQLVATNWARTVLWSLAFLVSVGAIFF